MLKGKDSIRYILMDDKKIGIASLKKSINDIQGVRKIIARFEG